MNKKLNALALGYAAAALGVLCMLILGILGNLGIYTGAVAQMQKWHLVFDLSVVGIVGGMIEAAIVSFIAGWLFGWFYNRFQK